MKSVEEEGKWRRTKGWRNEDKSGRKRSERRRE